MARSTQKYCRHILVRGAVDGWFICPLGCGIVAVCRHCVPAAPDGVYEQLCDAELRRLRKGPYAELDEELVRRGGME